MAKLNVYVNDELKARMDRYTLKWSQIASAAFEAAMNIEDRKEVNMEAASLERLRQSRAKSADRQHADAHAAGKKWALEEAEFEQLEALVEQNLDNVDDVSGTPAYGWGVYITDAVYGEENRHRDDIEAFCEKWLGVAYPTIDQVLGFIEGASEVHDQV